MEFTKDDVINSIKLFKNLDRNEINHLIKNIDVIELESNLKNTLKKFIDIDYYNEIKRINYKYEKLKECDDIKDSKPTKNDIKNIIKLFNNNENINSINNLIDNPFNVKDVNLRDTLFKLRLNKNPEKFLNKVFKFVTNIMDGGNQYSEQSFNSPNQDIMRKQMKENMEYEKQQQMQQIQQQSNIQNQMMNPQMTSPQQVIQQHPQQQIIHQQPYYQQHMFNQMQMNNQPSIIQMQQQMFEQQQQINQIQHQLQQLNQM